MDHPVTLPLNADPPLKSYNYLATIGSVLLADPKYLPFYLSHYVNYSSSDTMLLSVTNDIWYDHADVFKHVVVVNNCFPPELNAAILKSMLSQGFYGAFQVDEYYIPERWSYQTKHFTHDIGIYGYDKPANSFLTIGYNQNGQYWPQTIKAGILAKGMSSNTTSNRSYLYKIADGLSCAFDLDRFARHLALFAESRSPYEREWQRAHYGVSALENFRDVCASLAECGEWLDLRAFRMVRERNDLMLRRLDYLLQNHIVKVPDLRESYLPICQSALILFNMAMKYNLTRDKASGQRLVGRLRSLIVADHEFSCRLLDLLPKA